ncbi:MAG: tRNA (adenosine(37)-N6)-threonylcarbamoyltransferase complex transferase subunit TsaD [Polyangiaceae bacterium]
MIVLGVESSCDETAAAVVASDGRVLSDVVKSQIDAHAPYGGIVPEIAARDHVKAIVPVLEGALAQAGVTVESLDGVAATHRPGLVGALLVGLQAAKGLAWASELPLVGVDHLVGHLLSVFLWRDGEPEPAAQFPFVGLLVSGGHTALYRCDGPAPSQIRELGATRDDAAGEAFDKVAKLLGLGYPGGPVIDRLAAKGNAKAAPVRLPTPMSGSLEFSFSGLKSAMARHLKGPDAPRNEEQLANLCAAFQRAVTATLVEKTIRAARREGLEDVVVAGGVAANGELRRRMAAATAKRGLRLHVPPLASCTDNAAMIAYAGALVLEAGQHDALELGPSPRTVLPRVTRKGRGRR